MTQTGGAPVAGGVVIVDYRMGNVGSIRSMLKKLGVAAYVSADPAAVAAAGRIILPGVGAFDAGMESLEKSGLREALETAALHRRVPVLGICLGMQLLTRRSEEGSAAGLGWIAGETVRFSFDPKSTGLRIPHMGWNTVAPRAFTGLFAGFEEGAEFYFVHSYHVRCDREEDVCGTTRHGYEFASAVCRGNVHGVQFHPEKSHRFGLRLLANFLGLPGC